MASAAEAHSPRPDALGRVRTLVERAAPESLLAVAVAAFAATLAVDLSVQVNQDAWLAFLGGRSIAHHGLPHRDLFTIWGAGSWVDQQWLSQLALYGLYAAGGVALVAFAHALLAIGASTAAVAAGRRRASVPNVLLPLPFVFWVLVGSTWQARTQSFAYPLFVAVLLLLVADSRRPSRRVYLALPLLALWANLHGSVTLGIALVFLRGLERRRDRAPLLLAPLTLFASPYGLGLAGYYRHTLFNSAFAMLNEWQPPSFGLATAPFFALALGTIWLLGRARTSLTRYERLALVATLVFALTAMRNLGWFALTATALVPAALEELRPRRAARPKPAAAAFNVALAAVATGVLAALLAITPFRSGGWFTSAYPPSGANAVARAAGSGAVYADVKYADWLLFVRPELAGRVAFDARFELLSRRRIAQIYNFDLDDGGTWRAATRGFRLLVLDRANDSNAIAGLRREGARVLYDARGLVVLERPAAPPFRGSRA